MPGRCGRGLIFRFGHWLQKGARSRRRFAANCRFARHRIKQSNSSSQTLRHVANSRGRAMFRMFRSVASDCTLSHLLHPEFQAYCREARNPLTPTTCSLRKSRNSTVPRKCDELKSLGSFSMVWRPRFHLVAQLLDALTARSLLGMRSKQFVTGIRRRRRSDVRSTSRPRRRRNTAGRKDAVSASAPRLATRHRIPGSPAASSAPFAAGVRDSACPSRRRSGLRADRACERLAIARLSPRH